MISKQLFIKKIKLSFIRKQINKKKLYAFSHSIIIANNNCRMFFGSTNKFPPFAKDGTTNKLQLKLFDVKRHIRLDIRQHLAITLKYQRFCISIIYFFLYENVEFEPNKHHLQELLIYFFNLKKSAAEAHRLLVEAYGDIP